MCPTLPTNGIESRRRLYTRLQIGKMLSASLTFQRKACHGACYFHGGTDAIGPSHCIGRRGDEHHIGYLNKSNVIDATGARSWWFPPGMVVSRLRCPRRGTASDLRSAGNSLDKPDKLSYRIGRPLLLHR